MAFVAWTDAGFLAQLDSAFEDSARRSGPHLLCRAGCNQCCTGTFAISMLDRSRLQHGFDALSVSDPRRAQAVRERILLYRDRLSADYPGDLRTGWLYQDEDSQEAFEDFANDEVCPVLDLETGTCDLYAARPVTCRVFGPPVRHEDGLGVCELCFRGATETEITAAEMFLPDPAVETHLTAPLGEATTTIGFGIDVTVPGNEAMLKA